jgi:diguanylate cyclase (GGDEF)-like protein
MKQDITAEKVRWERLRKLAESDALTGLANRARFHSEFLDLAVGCDALADIGALVLFDLNDFKTINDRWGHSAGDLCITRFAERLAAAFPQARLVARIGGDEFAVLLPAQLSPAAVESLVRRRMPSLSAPIHRPDLTIPLGCSAGLAFNCHAPATSPDALFLAADGALYTAKRSGHTPLCVAPPVGLINRRSA